MGIIASNKIYPYGIRGKYEKFFLHHAIHYLNMEFRHHDCSYDSHGVFGLGADRSRINYYKKNYPSRIATTLLSTNATSLKHAGMSGVQQNAFQIGDDGNPVASQRLFQCRDCQQYVVIPSNLPQATNPSTSMTTGDLSHPDLEFPDQLEFSQQFILDDLYPFQTSTPDPVTNYFTFSDTDLRGLCQPDSLSFSSSDMHHIPYSQAINAPIAEKCPNLQNSCNPASVVETTAQTDVTSLLEMNVQQLRDMVYGLKERYDYLLSLNKSTNSLFSYYAYNILFDHQVRLTNKT
jgi:hypothetical protein